MTLSLDLEPWKQEEKGVESKQSKELRMKESSQKLFLNVVAEATMDQKPCQEPRGFSSGRGLQPGSESAQCLPPRQ